MCVTPANFSTNPVRQRSQYRPITTLIIELQRLQSKPPTSAKRHCRVAIVRDIASQLLPPADNHGRGRPPGSRQVRDQGRGHPRDGDAVRGAHAPQPPRAVAGGEPPAGHGRQAAALRLPRGRPVPALVAGQVSADQRRVGGGAAHARVRGGAARAAEAERQRPPGLGERRGRAGRRPGGHRLLRRRAARGAVKAVSVSPQRRQERRVRHCQQRQGPARAAVAVLHQDGEVNARGGAHGPSQQCRQRADARPPSASEEAGEQRSAKKHKKTQDGAGAVSFQQLEAEIVLVGHTSYVTGVAFRPKNSEHDEDVVVSAGSDRTVRLWDLVTQSCSQSLVGNRAVSDLSVNANGLVLTAHPDHCVRLWDPRAQQSGESIVQRTFRSHKEWVSSVAWHPDSTTNEHLFVSGGYDGTAKVWDARSTIPLHTVNAHEGKLLDLSWRNQDNVAFVTGGEDKKLNFFSV
ncbi:hypothetical protein ON010_g5355 [Phytophthora cinnamomi]|nr:hypothetical protein ON010_g5355 [Phytophthora cinnamomi]